MKKVILFASIVAISLISCDKEHTEIDKLDKLDEQTIKKTGELTVTEDVLAKLAENKINNTNVRVIDFMYPDGSSEKMFEMEGDIHMSAEQLSTLTPAKERDTDLETAGRNYHTDNLVSQNRRIRIIGYTGQNGNGLSEKEQNGLQWAVNNYNNLNINLTFELSFGTSYEDKDMVIYHNPNNANAGGSAGFPSNDGRPHKWVQIHGLNNSNTNIIEHVITHEIGHSVGLRHTDWQTRRSCGQNVNEGSAGVGANPIYVTPQGYDSTSLMLGCFSNSSDGEFNQNDIKALEFLYQ